MHLLQVHSRKLVKLYSPSSSNSKYVFCILVFWAFSSSSLDGKEEESALGTRMYLSINKHRKVIIWKYVPVLYLSQLVRVLDFLRVRPFFKIYNLIVCISETYGTQNPKPDFTRPLFYKSRFSNGCGCGVGQNRTLAHLVLTMV